MADRSNFPPAINARAHPLIFGCERTKPPNFIRIFRTHPKGTIQTTVERLDQASKTGNLMPTMGVVAPEAFTVWASRPDGTSIVLKDKSGGMRNLLPSAIVQTPDAVKTGYSEGVVCTLMDLHSPSKLVK